MKKAMKFYQLNMIYNTNLLNFFFICITSLIFIKNNCLGEDLKSGYHFSEPSTQKIQDDDFLNPGFIWVENGETLWNKKVQSSQLSCKSCHGQVSEMRGTALKFPKITKKGDLINLEQQINICRNENMSAETYEPESKNLLALISLTFPFLRTCSQHNINKFFFSAYSSIIHFSNNHNKRTCSHSAPK